MNRYRYKVYRPDGSPEEGTVAAPTPREAAALLHEKGFTVQRLRKEPSPLFRRTFSGQPLALFCREWSSLLAAGLPLTRALEVTASRRRGAVRRALEEVMTTISSGVPLSAAFRQSGLFPDFFLSMVEVGEMSGTLPEQLARLARYYEKETAVKRQFAGALAYPLFLLAFALAVFTLILTVILPSFSLLFEALALPIPPLTGAALALGAFLRTYGPAIGTALAALILLLFLAVRTEQGKEQRDRLLFRSAFVRRLFLIRFCAALSSLLRSGSPLSEALSAAEEAAGNREGRRRIRYVRERLSRGSSFASSLEEARLTAPLLSSMAASGEESGELPAFLGEAGRLMTEETEQKLARLKAILEPALILAVGGVTATLVFTVMIPIFTVLGRGW